MRLGAGEMVPGLRALVALAEDLDLFPTLTQWLTPLLVPAPGIQCHLLTSSGHQAYMWYPQTYAGKTLTFIK